ncbi:MAG TPA: 2-amino-4-hydroxy-6-hydroxymethyldihydropteridine diphosphokinase [Mesotoga sp.]|jgi:2-amino-4-hydroxy-6-hydroxymethyldihydropteridine diphosphokinase|nr:2-amino-4-hydroxy-6-hydroxymethyldihydropteridine diphosphokinase [Mesotoga sp.]MDI9375858.1 2-amino-4-hydroxy-6-hydroxymethyldihydropteridine diphosphokinase [Thermotogota bacterium]NLX34403.1 2-amino-4-hydroxy-6-hydroxymethyldihydropteridine diphosphokinase [Thermotogaceae bacterium]MDD5743214.1 2-amino-4-hydroxy-6-hydroxymethyldihydropteridine diphosphokinase [Mesotoga sp.]HOI63631.1 2-amino-4-hydroxy-6-hydroxymethyldihydropteridine diphosphokinase [Mesotoga sp.]
MENEIYLGFGSNLGDRLENLKMAFAGLKERGVVCEKMSTVFLTSPYGGVEQPDFLNCVGKFSFCGSPQSLLRTISHVENSLGRVRSVRWGPRTIDIDILLFGEQIIESDTLTIPHGDIINRAFVLVPLLEIDGLIVDPRSGRPYSEFLDRLDRSEWPGIYMKAGDFARAAGLEVK